MFSMFGGANKNNAPAAEMKSGGNANGSIRKDKKNKKAASADSSDSSIVKLDENGNPIEDEEEEEPLYEPDVLHVYDRNPHPDEREMPNAERQHEHEHEVASLQELSPKERKDRHSADVKSSVSRKQGQKKGGHGGGYTWTGGDDNDLPEGYVPDRTATAMQAVTVDRPSRKRRSGAKQEDFNLRKSANEFPTLNGNGRVPPSPNAQAAKKLWTQAVMDDPKYVA